jgi:hypothetical protein
LETALNFFGHKIRAPQMWVVIFATLFLLSAGSCGMQNAMLKHSESIPGPGTGSMALLLVPLGLIELVVMFVSLAGIVIVLILWAIGVLDD